MKLFCISCNSTIPIDQLSVFHIHFYKFLHLFTKSDKKNQHFSRIRAEFRGHVNSTENVSKREDYHLKRRDRYLVGTLKLWFCHCYFDFQETSRYLSFLKIVWVKDNIFPLFWSSSVKPWLLLLFCSCYWSMPFFTWLLLLLFYSCSGQCPSSSLKLDETFLTRIHEVYKECVINRKWNYRACKQVRSCDWSNSSNR